MSDTDPTVDLSKLTKAELIDHITRRIAETKDDKGNPELEHTGADHPRPDWPMPDLERRATLRSIASNYAQPRADKVSTLPRSGIQLDYEGHADVTLDLIEVDPEWTWTPGWNTPAGPVDPFAMGNDQLLGEMTVLGVTRPCVGSIPSNKVGTESAFKELTGDLIRNGAMRFGIGTALWSKAQRAGLDPDAGEPVAPRAPQAPPGPPPLPEGRITVSAAKRMLLEDCAGDTNCARTAWEEADFTVATITVGSEEVKVVDERAVVQFLTADAFGNAVTETAPTAAAAPAVDPVDVDAVVDADNPNAQAVDPETGEVLP